MAPVQDSADAWDMKEGSGRRGGGYGNSMVQMLSNVLFSCVAGITSARDMGPVQDSADAWGMRPEEAGVFT